MYLLYASLIGLGTKLAIAKRADEEVVCIFCLSQGHHYIKSFHHSCQTTRSLPQGAEKMSSTFLSTAAHPLNIAHSTQVSVLLLNKGTFCLCPFVQPCDWTMSQIGLNEPESSFHRARLLFLFCI